MATVGVVVAALLAGASAAALLLPADAGRLRSALPPPAGGRGRSPGPARAGTSGGASAGGSAVRRRSPAVLASALAGLGAAVVLPLPAGPVVGLAVAAGGPRLLDRLEPADVRARRELLVRDLPLLLDLLAACLAGGAALPAAAAAVAQAVGGPAGDRLAAVGAALQVGVPPGEAWAALAGPDPAERSDDHLAPAARALARAADGGAPVAAAVARLAADARADSRGRAEQAARRVGVLAVAPLGLCFLPAFVLLGIVPLVLSLAGPLLAAV